MDPLQLDVLEVVAVAASEAPQHQTSAAQTFPVRVLVASARWAWTGPPHSLEKFPLQEVAAQTVALRLPELEMHPLRRRRRFLVVWDMGETMCDDELKPESSGA